MLYSLGDRRVTIDGTCFVAPNAAIIGTVVLRKNASVWFSATVRGDTDVITIGEDSNVQDNSVLHTDEGITLDIGRGCTIGHRVMLHGCQVGDYSLVGIGATVLNRARIGKYCLIGAHTLITENKVIPDRSLVVGSPGRVLREVTDAEIERLHFSSQHYVDNARRYLAELREQS
jgi:carbonic anhydrase/acetyltransferase-like protein (isoleucine patch superfamily)